MCQQIKHKKISILKEIIVQEGGQERDHHLTKFKKYICSIWKEISIISIFENNSRIGEGESRVLSYQTAELKSLHQVLFGLGP